MIITTSKPIDEVASFIKDYRKILLVACAGCSSVCLTGGKQEAEALAAELSSLFRSAGKSIEMLVVSVPRQCEPEFVGRLQEQIKQVDAVISLGCGIGVQLLAETFADKWILPALNTSFAGATVHPGQWEERCGLCGDCMLHLTGGICPIARCAKSSQNGPCGGSQRGQCELGNEVPCAWDLIYRKLSSLGRLDLMTTYRPPKDWSKCRSGGPRVMAKEGTS